MKFGPLAVTKSFVNAAKEGSIWFLHGTGDTGLGMQSWLHKILHREFNFNNHKILYPTAPSVSYSLFGGKIASVWYNRLKLTPDMLEDINSIDRTAISLGKLIKEDTQSKGIPMSSVVVGGFSLGGSMALHLAYRLHLDLAGCFALSSFVPPDSKIYDNLTSMSSGKGSNLDRVRLSERFPVFNRFPMVMGESRRKKSHRRPSTLAKHKMTEEIKQLPKLPKLFMSCGTSDPLVHHSWSKATFSKLREHGTEGHFYTIPKLEHTIHPLQLHLLHNWIDVTMDNNDKSPSQGGANLVRPEDNLHLNSSHYT